MVAGLLLVVTLAAVRPAPAVAAAGHPWVGIPGGIAGRSVYSVGEFIYTDGAFDDHGAAAHPFVPDYEDSIYPGDTSGRNFHGTYTYPANAQTSAGGYDLIDTGYRYNAADVVELRVAADAQNLYFLASFNYLPSADGTVLGLGIDADLNRATGGAAWPLGANLNQANGYEYFLTAFGTGGYLTTYTPAGVPTTRPFAAAGITISEDLPAYRYEIRVPRTVMDPGRSTWRLYGGAGLWDSGARTWRQVLPGLPTPATPGGGGAGLPNVFDLLFKRAEPVYPVSSDGSDFNYWDEMQQAADLAATDISADHADVDFGRLADGYTSGPGDLHGTYERTYRSSFNFGAGLVREARRPHDDYDYQSPTQPYEVYVPTSYDPARPAPLWILEHYRGGNYRSYTLSAPNFRAVADALGAIVVIPNGRGQYRMCESDAEADFFEVLQDAVAHYRIDPSRVYLGGMSMGGFCTWRLGLLYPDLFAAAIVYSGWPYSAWPAYGAAGVGPLPGTRYDLTANAANAADLPVQVIHGSNDEILPFPDSMGIIAGVEQAGGEINVNVYLGRHHDSTFPGTAYEAGTRWLTGRVRNPSPARVDYVINPLTANPDPGNGAPADYMSRAGWCNHPPFAGTLTRVLQPGLAFVYDRAYWLRGLNVRDCGGTAAVTAQSRALLAGATSPVPRGWSTQVDSLGPYLNEGQTLSPAPAPATSQVDVKLANLASATVDVAQAGLGLSLPMQFNVETDGPSTLALALPPALAGAVLSVDSAIQAYSGDPSATLAAGKHVLVLAAPAPPGPGGSP